MINSIGRKSLGTTPVYGVKDPSGVAYVVIPEDQDRSEYIKHCYMTGTLMLRNELGSTWKNVFASNSVMRDIVFPDKSTERGSLVIWIRIPKHNTALALSIVNLKNEVGLIREEQQQRFQKRFDGNLVDFDMRAQRSTIDLSIGSAEDNKGVLRINVANPNKTAEFLTNVRGKIDYFADNSIRLGSYDEILLNILDEDGEEISHFKHKKDEGWSIKDQYDNVIHMRDGSISLKVSEGKEVWITEDKISLSREDPEYKSVLGEKLKEKLEELIDEIKLITVPTAQGPSGIPNNAAQLTQIRSQLSVILSDIVKLD